MSRRQKLFKIAGTCAVAIGAGFLMQAGETFTDPYAETINASDNTDIGPINKSAVAVTSNGFIIENIETTSLPPINNLVTASAITEKYKDMQAPDMGEVLSTPANECDVNLSATVQPAAMVVLDVDAPCHKAAFFVVKHNEMNFSAKTDDSGYATIKVPALSKDAVFSVAFNNLKSATVQTNVNDLSFYDRIVLQWRGEHALQLHALEFGASIGEYGHIWSASENDMDLTLAGRRGYMMRLGRRDTEIPYFAEIYTFPTGLSDRRGSVELQIGAAVTSENCNRNIKATGIQTGDDGIAVSSLEVNMPACTAIGQSVLRDNMFADVVLTAN